MELPLTMPDPLPRHGRVVLRAYGDSDVDMLRNLASDPYHADIGSLRRDASDEEARAYIERQHSRLSGAGWSFCIADPVTDEALGGTGLWLTGIDQGRASIGYAVAPRARGRGVARDALRAVTAFAWTVPEIHRLELFVEPWNAASLATARSGGYEREGLLRSYRELGGRRVDLVLLSLLRLDC